MQVLIHNDGSFSYNVLKTIGLARNSKMLVGVIYSNYRASDIEMTIAAVNPAWGTKGNIKTFFKYPFEQLKVPRVTMIVAKPNNKARKFIEGIGWKV